MGQRGPKPLPANVHQLRGNASKKPIGAILDEFRPEVEIPDSPVLDVARGEEGVEAASPYELERYGLASASWTGPRWCCTCQAWAKMVWAERALVPGDGKC
jgi:hypothetical protein